ncbi:MAG: tetratricopeptide repeat-containing sensor histidine kinase [Cytophagales bacterium]|nr:tetratricopeptide repeat-containing sensor histidine kinase [Cytophagales bacterium]
MNRRIVLLVFLLFRLFAVAAQDTLAARLQSVSGTAKADSLNRYAETDAMRVPARALRYAQQALALSLQLGYEAGQVRAENNIGEYYINEGRYGAADSSFRRALGIARTAGDSVAVAQTLGKVASVNYLRGDYEAALRYAAQALALQKQQGDTRALANTLSLTSHVYGKQGVSEKALRNALQALRIRRQLGDDDEVAKSLNALGEFYLSQNNPRRALHDYLEALRISRKSGNRRGVAASLDKIGSLYSWQERYQEALLYLREAMTISEELAAPRLTASVYTHMGEAFTGLNDYKQAFRYLAAALRVHYTLKNNLDMVPTLNAMGRLHARQGDPKTALSYHYQALSLVEDSQLRLLRRDTYKALSDTYLEIDDSPNFTRYYRQYAALQDSIQNNMTLRKIADIQNQLEWQESQARNEAETEQQRREVERQKKLRDYLIAIIVVVAVLCLTLIVFYVSRWRTSRRLKQQNETIIQKNRQLRRANESLKVLNAKLAASEAELRKSNETKDKFFSIIAHDLRAPLATFSSFLSLLSGAGGYFTPEEIGMVAKSTQQSLKNLTDLLNNLLQWSRSQMGRVPFNPRPVPLRELAAQTVNLLAEDATQKEIELRLAVDENAIAYADVNMLDFVLRNLVSNAIKFTPRGGSVSIESVPVNEPDKLGVCVADTGVGISAENQQKIFNLSSGFTTAGGYTVYLYHP